MPPRLSLRPRQVLEEDRLGKRIGHVQFGLMGNEEIERLAEYEVISDRGYEQPGRTPVVNGVLDQMPMLRRTEGKMVYELRPSADWDKGKAVAWLRDALGGAAVAPIYIGDDVADEDALAYVESVGGVGVKVSAEASPSTAASFMLRDPAEVAAFLRGFVDGPLE